MPSRKPAPIAHEWLDFRCELDGPLAVASGRTVDHAVLLTDPTNRPVTIGTNGRLTAYVLDPVNGRVVGGFVGAQAMTLVPFALRYQEAVRIPLLVGTASFDPAWGYAVPAGDWALSADLRLSDGRILAMPPLPFRITEADS